jgi:Spy/CpxP family protein refolding chaperone
MKKGIFTAALLIAVMALASGLQAQQTMGKGRGQMGMCNVRGQMGCGNCLQSINVTTDQQKKINILRLQCMKETTPERTRLQEKQLEMTILMTETTPESDKVMNLQKEISKLQAQVTAKCLSYQLKARKLLSAEQVQALPPGCKLGFRGRCGSGQGCGMGQGRCRMGRGPGKGFNR